MSRPTEFFLLLGRRQSTWTIPELIIPDESKRAEKMLELTLSQVFSGLEESKKNDKLTLESILGCFHGLDERQIVLALS
jgi:hypothetical protein